MELSFASGNFMKAFLIYALALGLVVAGPNSLPLCALLSPIAGDCTAPETQSQCDKMAMGEHRAPAAVTSRSDSCCAISQAPLPEPKTEVSKTTVKLELAPAFTSATQVLNSEKVRPRNVLQELSPPPLRSLLCTFLI